MMNIIDQTIAEDFNNHPMRVRIIYHQDFQKVFEICFSEDSGYIELELIPPF